MKKNSSKIKTTALTVDEYLKVLPDDYHNALQGVRNIIKSVIPEAKERVSYHIPIISLKRDTAHIHIQPHSRL